MGIVIIRDECHRDPKEWQILGIYYWLLIAAAYCIV